MGKYCQARHREVGRVRAGLFIEVPFTGPLFVLFIVLLAIVLVSVLY